jgi:tetratricopeptide (TPR) repeat protein
MNNSHNLQQTKDAVAKALKPYGKKAFEYFRQGNYEAALQHFRQSVDLSLPKARRELRLLGQSFSNFALACNHAEKIEWAERAYNFALTIHCDLLDPHNSDAAVTLYNMGLFLRDRKNDLEGAFNYLAYALEMWKVVIKNEGEPGYIHYLASCLHALGEIFAEQQQFDRARQNFEQALKLRQDVLPDEHPDLAQSFADLGTLYMLEGNLEAAHSNLRQALHLYKTALGPNDPMTCAVASALDRIDIKRA